MKNTFFMSLVALLCLNVNAQVIEFTISNPMPRVGEAINLSYSILSQDHPKFSFEEIDAPRRPNCKDNNFVIASGNFRQSKGSEKVGKVTYGPFEFKIDSQVYKSEVYELEVYPKLPNVQKGVWVTLVENGGKHYIVIEHRMAGKVMPQRPTSGSKYKVPSEYLQINEDKFNSDHLKVVRNRRSGKTGGKLEGDLPKEESAYSTFNSVYEIWISEDYMGDFVFTSDFITNLPEGLAFENVAIVR